MYKKYSSTKTTRKKPSEKTKQIKTEMNNNIDQEYIENLKKQLHFMNLEIQKQKSNKGFFGLQTSMGGVMQQPTNHILEAKSKILGFEKELKEQENNLENQVNKREENVHQLNAQKENLQQNFLKLNQEFENIDDIQVNELQRKLKSLANNLEVLIEKEQKLQVQKKFVKRENEELTEKQRKQNTTDFHTQEEKDKEINKLKEMLENYEQRIIELQNEEKEFQEIVKNDNKIQNYEVRNDEILNLLDDKEQEVDNLQYKVYELQTLRKIAMEHKLKENEERKRLYRELERLTQELQDSENLKKMKLQRKVKEEDTEQIEKLRIKKRIEEEELNDIKGKQKDVRRIFVNMKIELNERKFQEEKILQEIEDKKQEKQNLQKEHDELKITHDNLQNQIDDQESKRNVLEQELEKLGKQSLNLNQEICGLQSQIQYIEQNFDFDKIIQNINVEELKEVVNSNQNVNSMISDLLSQCNNMKQLKQFNKFLFFIKFFQSIFCKLKMIAHRILFIIALLFFLQDQTLSVNSLSVIDFDNLPQKVYSQSMALNSKKNSEKPQFNTIQKNSDFSNETINDINAYIDEDKDLMNIGNNNKKFNIEASKRIFSYLFYNILICFGFYLLVFGFKIALITSSILNFIFSYYFILYSLLYLTNYDSHLALYQMFHFFLTIFLTYGLCTLDYFHKNLQFIILDFCLVFSMLFIFNTFFGHQDFDQDQQITGLFLLLFLLINSCWIYFFKKYSLLVGSAILGGIIVPIYFGIIIGHINSFENRYSLKQDTELNLLTLIYLLVSLVVIITGMILQYLLSIQLQKGIQKEELNEIKTEIKQLIIYQQWITKKNMINQIKNLLVSILKLMKLLLKISYQFKMLVNLFKAEKKILLIKIKKLRN